MSLRRLIGSLAIALVVLGIAAFGGIAYLTSTMNGSAQLAVRSLTSVRAAEEVQRHLLLFDHARKDYAATGSAAAAAEMRSNEAKLRQWVRVTYDSIENDEENKLVLAADHAVNQYLEEANRSSPRGGGPQAGELLDSAHKAADELLELNTRFAEAGGKKAATLNYRANIVRFSLLGAILLFAIGIPIWLRWRLYAPFEALVDTLARRTDGEHHVRAAVVGPAEFREIAARYNAMADALDRQRQNQLAYLAAIAHELRNPLAAVKLSVSYAARPEADLSADALRQKLGIVDRQVDRVGEIIQDLLDVSRIEAGRFELAQGVCDLAGLAAEAVALFEDTSAKHQVELARPAHPVRIVGDRLRITQVLNNLLSNAIKYSPAGGQILVRVAETDGRAVLEVADQGIGISREDQARLFEPFRRVGKERRSIPGIGLGLSVSRRLVLAQGGTIDVESTPGRGTTFRITFPLAEDVMREQPRPEAPAPMS